MVRNNVHDADIRFGIGRKSEGNKNESVVYLMLNSTIETRGLLGNVNRTVNHFDLEEAKVYLDNLAVAICPYAADMQLKLQNKDLAKAEAKDRMLLSEGINQKVNREITYMVRMQPGVQTSEKSLEAALGSCRDTAWLLVQMLRHLGLAARFVSGYSVQLMDQKKSSSPTNTDIMALHAWAEVYIPGAGWIGLDPTSGLLAGEGHIPLACTPNPDSAAPITGTSELCKTTFSYNSDIIRL